MAFPVAQLRVLGAETPAGWKSSARSRSCEQVMRGWGPRKGERGGQAAGGGTLSSSLFSFLFPVNSPPLHKVLSEYD